MSLKYKDCRKCWLQKSVKNFDSRENLVIKGLIYGKTWSSGSVLKYLIATGSKSQSGELDVAHTFESQHPLMRPTKPASKTAANKGIFLLATAVLWALPEVHARKTMQLPERSPVLLSGLSQSLRHPDRGGNKHVV